MKKIITWETFRKFETVTIARKTGHRDTKVFQREAVTAYLAERVSRATAFMIRFDAKGNWK